MHVTFNLERLELIQQFIHVMFLHLELFQFVLQLVLALGRHRRLRDSTGHVFIFRLGRSLKQQHVTDCQLILTTT